MLEAHWRLITFHAELGSIDALSFADALHGWAIASPGCGDIACPPNGQSDAGLYDGDRRVPIHLGKEPAA